MDYRDLSFVQYKILSGFIRSPGLSYSHAQPENIDRDLYKYHLKFLVEKGILSKSGSVYRLTDAGKKLVQYLDVHGDTHPTFKISVLCYVLRNHSELLMQKRLRQPFFGDIDVISGKIQPGETPENAAVRKLAEESGLSASFSFLGVIRKVRRWPKTEIFEDTLYHICLAENPAGNLVTVNDFGENMWVSLNRVADLISGNMTYTPNSLRLLELISAPPKETFYIHEDITLSRI